MSEKDGGGILLKNYGNYLIWSQRVDYIKKTKYFVKHTNQ